jgi:hypothetical protein
MLFFGPFTGAGLLRHDPPDRYVFNYRASYAEETAAMVKYLIEVRHISPSEIAVFAQEDGYGDAGFNGVAKMLRKYKRPTPARGAPAKDTWGSNCKGGSKSCDDLAQPQQALQPGETLRVGYKRNTLDVDGAVETILKAKSKIRAVIMVPTYKPAARFITKVKTERPDIIFSSVSFVGSQALAEELMASGPKIAEGVIVTQVVPLPTSRSTAVLKYQDLLPKYSLGEKPDFVSLEGYLAASLLIEGLRKVGPKATTEQLIDALEQMHAIDLGVGAQMGFGMGEHQASHKVWGTVIDATGAFQSFEMD